MNFEGRINRFKKELDENAPITSFTRKQTNEYLNGILESTSARNRNNSKIDLNSLFEVLANDEIIPENFIKRMNTLKTKPERKKNLHPRYAIKYLFLSEKKMILYSYCL